MIYPPFTSTRGPLHYVRGFEFAPAIPGIIQWCFDDSTNSHPCMMPQEDYFQRGAHWKLCRLYIALSRPSYEPVAGS